MAALQKPKSEGREGKGPLMPCFILFAVYFISILFGKLNVAYGLNLPHFGNVAEFLLLFTASITLIVAALKAEKLGK